MIQQFSNGLIMLLLAKFVLNDVPHAAGLVGNPGTDKPTPAQIRYITALCMRLKISEPLEERVQTKGEAGKLIRELEAEVRKRKALKGGNPGNLIDLEETLPPTKRERPMPTFYSPRWAALHEDVPRYWYHVPDGRVAFGKTIKAYRIQETEYADTFGPGYSKNEYVWLSPKIIYPMYDAYIIDITKLSNEDVRSTGQYEGNILHRGDIPPDAVVGISKAGGRVVLKEG